MSRTAKPPEQRSTAPSRDIIGRGPSLADTLALRLKDEIVSGRLRPGEKLATEQQISETYGVSRPTVREAIGRLKHDGLVITRQGAGAFVADPGAVSVFRLDIADFSNREEIRNIVELLMAVEATATEHAAVRRTKGELKAIEAQLRAMQAAVDRGETGVDEDVAFHRSIVEATGNPFFRDLSDFLDRRVRNFIRTARSNTARIGGMAQAVQAEHQAIFDAIVRKDAAAARAAAENHLRNAASRLALYLER
ncbi:FadR/GntR family transcriptional regulator [Microvirga makkahensis]|uniref:FCD domain-containing protein n=1 Tax=Microvirga makkahensis TaxID=1128670 RepID=A0A7X3MP55_9HYPH|nr:FadR/GntR family transcriptional regulator [Microvirga makkahensis]MXQ10605.1 FCD domain-containing protein [Microvirga makkahensis]